MSVSSRIRGLSLAMFPGCLLWACLTGIHGFSGLLMIARELGIDRGDTRRDDMAALCLLGPRTGLKRPRQTLTISTVDRPHGGLHGYRPWFAMRHSY